MNFQNFCELFQKIKNSGNEMHYLFVLVSSNKNFLINRDPISNYEMSIVIIFLNQKLNLNFFILEDNYQNIQEFLEDSQIINDGLKKSNDDEFMNSLVYKKFNKKLKKIEIKEKLEKEKYESLHNKTFSLMNNTSITNINNFLSNRSIDNLNILYKDQTNLKETNSCEYTKFFNLALKMKANRILPEGNQNGILLINSNGEIKFKALTNNYKSKTFKTQLSKIQGVIRYRYVFKYKAINMFLFDSRRSKLFEFETESDSLEVYKYLTSQAPNLEKNFTDVDHYCKQWSEGLISNYEYLIKLNKLASRSFSDLSQYPIMPWILKNYEDDEEIDLSDERNYRDLSKPVGALNEIKLERFKEKYHEMLTMSGEIPYLYGTFYSTPAYTLQFLFRSRPLYFLRMNNGSFEPLNALFKSIKQVWNSSYSIGRDVKEIIPEFYSSNGDFLVNILNMDLGKSSNDDFISNVILPKWAKDNNDFVSKMRAALESDYVSKRLNNWIDLIFGYKSQNEEAVIADNLFYPLTYEHNVNLDNMNYYEKQGTITQLLEYGQIPVQLFSSPHPRKIKKNIYKKKVDIVNESNVEELIEINTLLKNENDKIRTEMELMKNNFKREKEKIMKDYEELKSKIKEENIIKEKKLNVEKDSIIIKGKSENETNFFPIKSKDKNYIIQSKSRISPINIAIKQVKDLESSNNSRQYKNDCKNSFGESKLKDSRYNFKKINPIPAFSFKESKKGFKS